MPIYIYIYKAILYILITSIVLGTLKTKRAYDSIDPFFDDSLPSQSDVENNFYVSFKKYFDLNARWSERNNVPSFGDDSSSREDVEKFYKFWYDFKSWREFSYLDEENKEKGQDRDERRWIEKENKVARIKRKKEEMARIRSLVDLAYNNDKRIQKFKNEDKERKLATKKAKMDAAQAMKAEQERILRETQLAKERAEKAEQKRIEQIRIQKEQLKKALRKERRVLRDRIKDYNYFQNYDKDMMKIMEGVEKICECCNLEELQELNRNLLRNDPCETFFKALDNANEKIASDRKETIRIPDKVATNNDVKEVKKSDIWTDKNMELLIKAVNLFPAGTFQRWDVIAAFINQHAKNDNSITSRDVLVKVKYLQSNNFSKNSMKVVDSKQQNNCDNFGLKCNSKDTNNTDDVVVTNDKLNGATDKNKDVENSQLPTESRSGGQISTTTRLWTKEEQILLEQAIRTYPATTPERWERVAECIPNRTKKDCLRRVKELVELVNAKKEAQEHVK